MRGKSIYVSIIGLILLFVIIVPIINNETKNTQQITTELQNVEIQKQIWTDVVNLCDKWTKDEITREELANEGHKLMQQFKELEGDTYDNSTEVLSDSNSIKLETQVMLFDIVRGFDMDGNEYAEKEKIKEETLAYVYPKRAKTFDNLYNYFIEKYKQ